MTYELISQPRIEREYCDEWASIMVCDVRRLPTADIREYGTSEPLTIELRHDQDGRYRWYQQLDGADTEVSGATVEDACEAAYSAWASWCLILTEAIEDQVWIAAGVPGHLRATAQACGHTRGLEQVWVFGDSIDCLGRFAPLAQPEREDGLDDAHMRSIAAGEIQEAICDAVRTTALAVHHQMERIQEVL